MTTVIYFFRDDLRLQDNPALTAACARATHLLPVCHLPEAGDTGWGFPDMSPRRQAFRLSAMRGLDAALRSRGSRLFMLSGRVQEDLPALARALDADVIHAEDIATPAARDEIQALHLAGLDVSLVWQSSLLAPAQLPWSPDRLPDVFTAFRHKVESAGIQPAAPCPAPTLPPLPALPAPWAQLAAALPEMPVLPVDVRSSFPFPDPAFLGDEHAGAAHLAQYLARGLPHSYKATRNQLQGIDYSSKLSPWLACGSLSPRQTHAALTHFESEHGRTDSSYWLWFELLWRDHFRLLHLKHGDRLYQPGGLSGRIAFAHDPAAFQRWREGRTGQPLVDAGLRELAATGYLSNRLRQIVASYLVHDLGCDWRAGAAWFEHTLIDFDRYSNQGNWLYIAGVGTDPRGGRRFDPLKQTREHDPDGAHRRRWQTLIDAPDAAAT